MAANPTHLVHISDKAVAMTREICSLRPSMSDGVAKRRMAAAVAEELRNPKPHYPPMAMGQHDFIAILEPDMLMEMEHAAYLVVKKNTEYPEVSTWVVPTVLLKEDYESRVREYKEGNSLHSLKDNQTLLAAIQAHPDTTQLLVDNDIIVVPEDKPFLIKGFPDKSTASEHINGMLEAGIDSSRIRVFELKPLKIQVSF